MNEQISPLLANVPERDVECLHHHRDQVKEYLRLGRKWGFFEESDMSASADRSIMKRALIPESHLAVLIHRRWNDLQGFEKQVDREGITWLVRHLLEQCEEVDREIAATQGTTVIPMESYLKNLKKTPPGANPLAHIKVPAPLEGEPNWFHAIRTNNNLSPDEIETLLNIEPVENKIEQQGTFPRIARIEEKTRDNLGKAVS